MPFLLLNVPSKPKTHYRTLIKVRKKTESDTFGLGDGLRVVNTTKNLSPTKEAMDLLLFPVPDPLPKSCFKMTNVTPEL